jgi:hypothetical protein
MTMRLAGVPLFLLALGGCYSKPTAAWQPVRVVVENFLTEPVSITSGGTTYGSFSTRWTALALPPGAATLTWTPTAPVYSDSSAVPSDLTIQTVALTANPDTVVITNVVNGQKYFSPWLFNSSGDTVDVGIVDGGSTRLCVQLGTTNFQLAYYRLTSTVEVHVFRSGTNCTGSYITWNNASLAAYQVSSGVVQLNITTAP